MSAATERLGDRHGVAAAVEGIAEPAELPTVEEADLHAAADGHLQGAAGAVREDEGDGDAPLEHRVEDRPGA